MSQRPVMIYLRETQILERQMPQPAERRVNIHCSRAHFFKERAQLVLVHRKFQDSSAPRLDTRKRGAPNPPQFPWL